MVAFGCGKVSLPIHLLFTSEGPVVWDPTIALRSWPADHSLPGVSCAVAQAGNPRDNSKHWLPARPENKLGEHGGPPT